MLNWKELVAELVASQTEGTDAPAIAGLLEYPPNSEMGDLSLPCFKLSKQLRKAPQAIAEELKGRVAGHGAIVRAEAVNGYLNLFLKRERVAAEVVGEVLHAGNRYGAQALGAGKTIVIDYSSPNIAKSFHIGHLRTTMIGNALYRIFAHLGYHCIGINHLGDWGTQFGKLIVAYRLWGEEARVREEGIAELQRLYVKFHDEAEQKPELEDDARAWFVKLEQKDEEANRLWEWFIDISLKEFHRTYELLGVSFDSFKGESFYIDKVGPVIEELQQKSLLVEDEGAMIVRLDDYGMPPVLILKKDGSTLYHTRDIAAALYRKTTYDFDKVIYVTDAGQSLHFQQWFKIIELMGYDWAKDLVHVPYGKISLESGKMSTRKGNVVLLEELLQQAIDKTQEIIDSKNPDLANKEEIAKQVGIGAVVFSDLSTNRMKDIVFSWEDALNFDGETGPYVQYTHARACSVLRKANGGEGAAFAVEPAKVDYSLLTGDAEFGALKELYLFRERVEQAADKLEPSIVSRYLVDLAQAFNRFYKECPILVDDLALRTARLALVACVRQTLRNGLALIGLQAPERM